jgi:hypothetical protein
MCVISEEGWTCGAGNGAGRLDGTVWKLGSRDAGSELDDELSLYEDISGKMDVVDPKSGSPETPGAGSVVGILNGTV